MALGIYQRMTLFFLLALMIWLVFCLPPLLTNRPDAFQASGSLIVIMAILIYARERALRQNDVALAQRNQINAMLDEHDTWGSYHESRVKRSALETEAQLIELRCAVSDNKEQTSELNSRIAQIQKTLSESRSHHEHLHQQMQKSHAKWVEVHSDAEEIVQSQGPAAKSLERLEIALVVIGTLQWGYGDQLVRHLYSAN